MGYKTEQEDFWAGEFGDDYIARNRGAAVVATNLALFSAVLRHADVIDSAIEFGANIGMNLHALRQLLPAAALSAVEINEQAVAELRKLPGLTVHHSSLLDFDSADPCDLALIKGVLIHINPQELPTVYDLLYRSSRRYICVAEYYNPSPVEIAYRGHEGRLFKRDFAGEMLDRFDDLRLLDYGFAYHRDTHFSQDDITWFLLEKNR